MRSPAFKLLLASTLTIALSPARTKAAVYQEVGGRVVVEAVHFDYRNFEFTDAPIPHHFHIVPDEDNANTPAHPWADTGWNPLDPGAQNMIANSRSGHYVQIVPDSGANNGNCTTCPNENVGFPPYVEYKLNITTIGTYQLYLRQVGWDGSSDSFFAQILEFAPPGPGPNFYRYAPDPDSGDFAALRNNPADGATVDQGWSGYAAPAPRVDGGGGEVPALYNITTPGLYTIRLSQREDGAAVDAFILQLASLPAPVNSPAPVESAVSTINPPYVRAVDPTPGQEQVPPDNNVGCQIVNGPSKNVVTNTIRLIVDGATVSPFITQTGSVTYVSYSPSPLLTSGKAINWSVIFSDNGIPATSYTNSFPFKVLTYSPIPASYAVPAGSVDKTKPGFLVRPYQTDEVQNDSVAFAEDQLSGLHGPNNADLSSTNAQGYIEVTNVINFDSATPPVADNFPFTADFPGVPSGGMVNNLTEEILTWLDLQPGIYRMVVNGDNGYKVSIGVDPRDKAGLVLGAIDGGAHTFGDLLLVFQIQTAGIYPFRLLYYNANDTAASVEWLTKNQFGRKALVNSSTNTALAIKAYRSGPSFPYVSRLSSSASGFIVDFTDAPGVSLNANSIQVTLNGSSVMPNIGKTNAVTTIAYSSATPLLSGSTNTVNLTYTDSSGGGTKARSFDFVAPVYATIPPAYAVGAPDTSKPGFTVKVNRIDAGLNAAGNGIVVQPNTIAFTEQQLAGTVTNAATGQRYPNAATPNPSDGTFIYPEPTVINYDRNAGSFGNFIPDNQMPGIAGATDAETANAALEILTYLNLPAGLIRMGVNSDDGFRLSPAKSVADTQNALTLGIFDGGRGAADTFFDFYVQQAGTYPMRLIWENGGGDANVEWFSVNQSNGSLVLINDTASASSLKAYRSAVVSQPAPQISATISGGNIAIHWSNGGTLESTTNLSTSPIIWTTTGNSSGTFSEAATGIKFYRVKR